jgi:hypothetical protein
MRPWRRVLKQRGIRFDRTGEINRASVLDAFPSPCRRRNDGRWAAENFLAVALLLSNSEFVPKLAIPVKLFVAGAE